MSPRHLLRGAAITAAATALIAASATSPALAHGNGDHGQGNHGHADSGGPTDINGYRSVGYLMSDTPVTRDYQIEDLLRTGAIDDVTHINYAFGNVTTNLKCEITDVAGEGDAQNDYLRLVSAADSVDGKKDKANKHQRLAGNFNH
jgi:chitinase